MSRRRRIGRRIDKRRLKKKHQADCKAGKHTWRPVNIYYANWAKCVYCDKRRKTKTLSKVNREIVGETAKTLRVLEKKVEALHPRKVFNKDGY